MWVKRVGTLGSLKPRWLLKHWNELKTVNELTGQYKVHPTQRQEGGRERFAEGRRNGDQESEAVQAKLYEGVGHLKMELDWIKNLPSLVDVKRR